MSRTIKFRAYAGDRNAMYPNVGFQNHTNGFSVLVYDSYTGEENGWMDSHSHKMVLMQFTGLKDKNGKEIYEGDILQFSDKLEWYKSHYRFNFDNKERKEIIENILNDHIKYPYERREIKIPLCYEWLLSSEIQTYWEVIGNVFENPDLLEIK